MRTVSTLIVCISCLFATVSLAADAPYLGRWSVTTDRSASAPPTLDLSVAEGFDLVVTQGASILKANFDGRDYRPVAGPETVRISRVGSNGFSMTVSINGKPVAVDTFTVSEDGRTLTQVGGPFGQPPNHKVVYER